MHGFDIWVDSCVPSTKSYCLYHNKLCCASLSAGLSVLVVHFFKQSQVILEVGTASRNLPVKLSLTFYG
jgi:hypothetical protein